MTHTSRTRRHAGAALLTSAVAGVGLLGGGAATASATAAPVAGSCEATALHLSVLAAASVTANHAGSATAPCAYENGVLDLSLLGLVSAKTVEATTAVTPKASAVATSTVEDLDIGTGDVVSSLTGPLTSGPDSISDELNSALAPLLGPGGAITTALAPLTGGLGLSVSGLNSGTLLSNAAVDLPGALAAGLPTVVRAGLIQAQATAVCVDGAAVLAGSTRLTGVNVLGTPIDAESTVARAISLDTATLSVADLVSVNDVLRSITVQVNPVSPIGLLIGGGQRSLYDVLTAPTGGVLGLVNGLLPVGTTLDSILTGLNGTLEPLISNTQIDLPTGLLRAVVTPKGETNEGGQLTETALALSVTALGQPVLSGELAQARVSAGSANCGPITPTPTPNPTPTPTHTPTPTPDPPVIKQGDPSDPASDPNRFASGFSERALQCETVRLRLLDVRRSGSRTLVQGVAERSYVGSTATIYQRDGNKKVGRATVAANGTFSTKVSLPAKKIRGTSKARYYAVISGDRTKALKFTRRMMVSELTTDGTSVTFRGRTTTPRATNQRPVQIQVRVSCSRYKTVATVEPNALGVFSATFNPPAGNASGVYRAYSKVPTTAPSRKLKPTYTLPRVLNFVR